MLVFCYDICHRPYILDPRNDMVALVEAEDYFECHVHSPYEHIISEFNAVHNVSNLTQSILREMDISVDYLHYKNLMLAAVVRPALNRTQSLLNYQHQKLPDTM
jgi:hypothetical protein